MSTLKITTTRAFEKVGNGYAAWSCGRYEGDLSYVIIAPDQESLIAALLQQGLQFDPDYFQRVIVSADKRFPIVSAPNPTPA